MNNFPETPDSHVFGKLFARFGEQHSIEKPVPITTYSIEPAANQREFLSTTRSSVEN
jgi:hypothetical protein